MHPRAKPRGYREAPYRELCVICNEEASRRCVQCARPLCTRHGPAAPGDLCADCELELSTERGEVRSIKNGVSLLLGVGGAAAALVVGPMAAVAAGLGVALAQGLGVGYDRITQAVFRRRRRVTDPDDLFLDGGPRIAQRGAGQRQGRRLGVGRRERRKKPMDVRQYRRYH